MAELNVKKPARQITIRHRGRGAQVFIYLGKLLRMFIYQNDWKVLPMSALIAALVGMVVRKRFFINMEGTLMGAFAIVCVCIWNGCFNSIQVICRERDVIKREHRSGMHVSSYIFSHMVYQALLCLAQTVITLAVTSFAQVQYPTEGLITKFFMVDFGISMFLITYASDMMSLWVSTLAHTTTSAMTIMPFVLIFQLVFSGGMLTLPAWTEPLTHFTISNPGLKVIAAQADTNGRPYATIANMISKMRDNEVGGEITVGQALDLLQDTDNEAIASLRTKEVGAEVTLREVRDALAGSEAFSAFRQAHVIEDITAADLLRSLREAVATDGDQLITVGQSQRPLSEVIDMLLQDESVTDGVGQVILHSFTVGDVLEAIDAKGILEQYGDTVINGKFTVGEAVDFLAGNADVQARRDTRITLKTTVGKLLDLAGEDNVKTFLEQKAAAASYNENYAYDSENIADYWFHLALFIIAFALLAVVTLEFIDKDKR